MYRERERDVYIYIYIYIYIICHAMPCGALGTPQRLAGRTT